MGIAVPVGVAVIGIFSSLWKNGDRVVSNNIAFNNTTVIVEQAREALGDELPEKVVETLNEAMRLIELKEFDKAVPLLASAADAAPVPALFTNLGAAHLASDNPEKAEEYFENALARNPDDATALLNLKQLPVRRLAGARLVNFSSQYHSRPAANILDGKPNVGWLSIDASLPQTFVLELPRQSQIFRFSFDNATQEASYSGISAKDVQISVSLEAEDLGYREVARYMLKKGEIAQGFKLDSPVRARWIKLSILSNHGNESYTELMEFRVIGEPVWE